MGALVNDILQNEDGSVTVVDAQDVEPILEAAKERARAGESRSKSGELWHLAEFPEVVVMQYCRSRGIGFDEFLRDPGHVRCMLDDPALRDFLVEANNPHKLFR